MQLLIYILIYPFIFILSILPFKVLYLISDCVYLIVYYIIGYRKKVVFQNLTYAFPNKSEKERKIIMKKFYKHFIDIFLEMIKSFTISEKEIRKRYTFSNIETLQKLEKEGKSIILTGSHYGNWEWIIILAKYINIKSVGAFNVIENKYFDRTVRKSREKYGTNLVRTHLISRRIIEDLNSNTQGIYGFLSDQSPRVHKTHHWQKFFGIVVPVHTGVEFLAKKHNLPVVMIKTKKIKRGYYTSEFKVLTKNPNDFNNYEITDMFLMELENQIKEKPDHYFWSHKRFKHKDKAPKNIID
jgi:KDO2-lipid IV(A) lauroyltransferase